MFQLHFQYPQALWLLAAVPVFIVIFVLYKIWRQKSVKRIGNPLLVKRLVANHSALKANAKFFLLILAFCAGCLALANPRKAGQGSNQIRNGLDVMVALDVSNSMLAADALGNTRLTAAKKLIVQLITTMPDNRFGLVLFAGQAYVQMPLTYDASAVQLALSTANPGTIASQGTSISDALKKAAPSLSTPERYKCILLVTDGETHDDGAIGTAAELAEEGITIHTIGIGSERGTTIIDTSGTPKKDAEGNVVISKLNAPLLQQLSTTAKGIYINLQNTNAAVTTLANSFATVEKTALPDASLLNYETFYFWLAAPMLLFLFIELFLPDRKKVNI